MVMGLENVEENHSSSVHLRSWAVIQELFLIIQTGDMNKSENVEKDEDGGWVYEHFPDQKNETLGFTLKLSSYHPEHPHNFQTIHQTVIFVLNLENSMADSATVVGQRAEQ